jgi:hypothetical protein
MVVDWWPAAFWVECLVWFEFFFVVGFSFPPTGAAGPWAGGGLGYRPRVAAGALARRPSGPHQLSYIQIGRASGRERV